MNNMRKHFRLTEEFTYGTLLIQSAYLPVGQTPADDAWETDHTYDWDSPQETLRSLLSAMSDFAGALAGCQTANIEYASKIVTLGKQLEALEQVGPTLSNTIDTLQAELAEANNQRNELRSQLVTAQRAAEANPIYMSAMERDTLLRALDERLKGAHASETDKVNAIKIVREHAVGMRLTSAQPVLLEAGNIVRVVLTERYNHEDRMFFVEKSTRDIANRLMKFIDAAKA